MKRIFLALLAMTFVVGGLVTMTAPANAATAHTASAQRGTPGCVTRAEYRRVRGGHTVKSVATIFGTWGREIDRNEYSYTETRWRSDDDMVGYQVWITDVDTHRRYRKCRSWRGWNRYVWVDFDNYMHRSSHGPGLRVYSKSA